MRIIPMVKSHMQQVTKALFDGETSSNVVISSEELLTATLEMAPLYYSSLISCKSSTPGFSPLLSVLA
jgi:hypothetical protein